MPSPEPRRKATGAHARITVSIATVAQTHHLTHTIQYRSILGSHLMGLAGTSKSVKHTCLGLKETKPSLAEPVRETTSGGNRNMEKPKLTRDIMNHMLLLRSYTLQNIPGSVWEGNVVMANTLNYIQQLGEWYHEEGAGLIFIGEEK